MAEIIKYFHEVMKEEQDLLKLSYEESVRQKEERKNKERKNNKLKSILSNYPL
jgi:hypothetical protein